MLFRAGGALDALALPGVALGLGVGDGRGGEVIEKIGVPVP